MMAATQKVLVTGPASELSAYFNKVSNLAKKSTFDLCLALDLFSGASDADVEALLAGKYPCPIPTYVAVGSGAVPAAVQAKVDAGEELCTNVSMLNKSGLLTLASGLRLATFGGIQQQGNSELDPMLAYFSSDDVEHFTKLATQESSSAMTSAPPPVDILLSHCFPPALPHASKKPAPMRVPEVDCAPLNEVAQASRARYHFIGGKGTFWEREPFSWPRDERTGLNRSFAIAPMNNPSKERWCYAFSIVPQGPAPVPLPANVTPSPFSAAAGNRGVKRGANVDDTNENGVPNFIFQQGGGGERGGKRGRTGAGGPPPEHYTCNICGDKGHWIHDCPEKESRSRNKRTAPPIKPDNCWFCLSNANVTKWLIVSIGEESYVTLPKGQLLDTDSSLVPGGGHVLIIPITHYSTLLSIPDDQSQAITDEIAKYKDALRACFRTHGASMVTFEIARMTARGGHAHIQACPLPDAISGAVEEAFRVEGEREGMHFEPDPEAAAATLRESGTGDYVRVELPDGRTMLAVLKSGQRFNLQFGRQVVANLLSTPERADWKECVKHDDEERADAQKFREVFESFDPTAEQE